MTIFRCDMSMRLIVVVATLVLVAGCGRPEVAACEDFIRSGLKAPATYKRVSATTRDERVSWEDHIREQPGDRNSAFMKRVYDMGKSRRLILIKYDAVNSYNAPIRDEYVCAFNLYDGDVKDRKQLATAVMMAKTQRDFRQFARGGGLPSGEVIEMAEPAFGCCQ